MPITIGTNIASLSVTRRLNEATAELSSVSERLSSGLRINHASDDAAGLAIGESSKVQSRLLTRAAQNVNDAVSFLSIGEGALNALGDVTIRQIELAEQAANGSLSREQRLTLQKESDALADEYNRIVETTKFNGIRIFPDTSAPEALTIQIGPSSSDILSVRIGDELSRPLGNGTFTVAGTEYTYIPVDLEFGDFNGDGKIDSLVGGRFANNGVTVHLGNGNGTFTNTQVITITGGGGIGTNGIGLADFNNDGKIDIAYGGTNGVVGEVGVHLGNGNGTFGASLTVTTNPDFFSLTVGDVNGDGNVDLISDRQNASAQVFLGNGNGTFRIGATIATFAGGAGAGGILLDVDSDGDLDYLYDGGTLNVTYNDGTGTFTARRSFAGNLGIVARLQTGDFNRDGVQDISAIGNNDTAISIFLGNSDGTFQAVQTWSTGGSGSFAFSRAAIADINGDGFDDIASISFADKSYHVLFGNGNGTFKAPISNGGGSGSIATSIGFADANGDGAPDAFFGMEAGVTVQLANTTDSPRVTKVTLATQADARTALNTLKAQQERISREQGSIGAAQSRLASTLNLLQTSSTVLAEVSSRILAADIAEESSKLVAAQIRQKVGASVLAQANLQPSIVLKLLE